MMVVLSDIVRLFCGEDKHSAHRQGRVRAVFSDSQSGLARVLKLQYFTSSVTIKAAWRHSFQRAPPLV